MTRLIRGSVVLAACVGLWSCGTDSTSSEAGVPFKIVSLPSVVFIKQDSSQLIAFQLVDELDGQIPEQWKITSPSPLFTVTLDSTYRPVYNADGSLTLPGEQTEVRATITGVALGIDSFTVSAGGKTLNIPVNVVPEKLEVTFSPASPAPGEVVTMTVVTPGLFLAPTATITFPGNLAPVGLTIAADGKSASFIPAPTTDTTATVTGVLNETYPTLSGVTLVTKGIKLTGSQSGLWTGALPATISPLVAGSITVTLDPVFAFRPVHPPATPADTGVGVITVFSFTLGQVQPILNSLSADSTTADLSVGPNVASLLTATNVSFKGAPQFQYNLTSVDSVISTVINTVPVTLSSYTPDIVEPIVLTAGAGFTFSSTAVPSWSAGIASVLSRTATTLTVQPYPGSAGSPTISGVIADVAPAFKLTLPGSMPTPLAMTTTLAASPFTGTDDPSTAPLVTPNGFIDAVETSLVSTPCIATSAGGGSGCLYYKINIAAAGAVPFRLEFPMTTLGSDLGLYFLDAAFNPIPGACDSHGRGTSASPETCTITFAAPGTYYIELVDYGGFYPGGSATNPPPPWIQVRF